MENSAEQLQGQERLKILAEKNDISDILFTILTSAGYDTISAVAMLHKNLDSLETFYRNNSQLFSAKEKEKLYSKCNNCPDNFILLPGHRIKLESFIAICCMEDTTANSTPKRKSSDEFPENVEHLLELPPKKPKNRGVKKSEAVILTDQACVGDVLALTQDKLRKAFQRWQAGHPLEYIRSLDDTSDYEVSVSANNQGEITASLIATVSCSNCNCAVKMTINRSGNFCISNATRHLVKCFNKKRKLMKQQMNKSLSVSNMVIIKNDGGNDESDENNMGTNGQVMPLLMHNYTVVPVTQAGEVVSTDFAEITCIPELPLN